MRAQARGRRVIPSESYSIARSVFLSALEVPGPGREAWLAEECRGDAGLLNQVRRLLARDFELVGGSDDPFAATADEPPPPARLGAFELLETLGRSARGAVHRARLGDDESIALERFRPGWLSAALLDRFRAGDARLERLVHPGIARFLGAGVVDADGGPQAYLATRLAAGPDLRRWASGGATLEARLELLARVCDAVEHAHRQGIVHRALEPGSIVVREGDAPCVLGFGVAPLIEADYRAATRRTPSGTISGLLQYLSPEQADGQWARVGPGTDVYALGVLAYELIAGIPPYALPPGSLHAALAAVLTAQPRPLGPLAGARRAALEAVLARALAKAPADRYASAAELAAELRRVAAGRHPIARAPGRHGPPVRAAVLLALAALAAFGLGRWAGGIAWFRTSAPTLGSSATRLRLATASLDSAAARLGTAGDREDSLQAVVAMCDRALARLPRAGRQPESRVLRRVARALAMEAHLRLGAVLLEPGEFEAAIAAGEAALADSLPGVADPASTEPSSPLAEWGSRDPRGAMALAASRLGRFSEPVRQQHRALAWNEAASPRSGGAGVDGAEPHAGPASHGPGRAEPGSARAEMLARLAAVTDSLPAARDAFRALGAAPADRGGNEAARWWLIAGFAAATRARLEGDGAGLDSAVTWLRGAAAAGSAARTPAFEVEARLQAVDALRARAGMRAGRASARADLESARKEAGAALALAASAAQARAAELAGLRQAEVELDLEALGAGAERIPAVVRALARADSVFPAIAFPVLSAEIETERARVSAILWTRDGDRFLREAARRRLESARQRLPDAESPSQARRRAAALAALDDAVPRPADLSYPVPAGPLPPARRPR